MLLFEYLYSQDSLGIIKLIDKCLEKCDLELINYILLKIHKTLISICQLHIDKRKYIGIYLQLKFLPMLILIITFWFTKCILLFFIL